MLMPGILLDLPGSCFTLKMIEFFDRQAIQEFDSPFHLKRGLLFQSCDKIVTILPLEFRH